MADNSSTPAPEPSGAPAPDGKPTSFINQKLGPFPAWVWVVAAGVLIFVYTKNKKSKTTGSTGSNTGAGTPQGPIDPNTGIPYSQETGAASESSVEQSLQANAQNATTNPQWEANAEAVLVGQGYPMVQVQSALNTYLAGGVLSSVQQEIVNASIESVGAPPSAPSTPVTSPTTPTPPVTTPKPPTGNKPPPATGTPKSAGEGTINIGGKLYTILGEAGKDVYQVAGGAPVFFGNGNSVAQGSAAEKQAAEDGGYAYTPVQYDPLVSKTATAESPGKF